MQIWIEGLLHVLFGVTVSLWNIRLIIVEVMRSCYNYFSVPNPGTYCSSKCLNNHSVKRVLTNLKGFWKELQDITIWNTFLT